MITFGIVMLAGFFITILTMGIACRGEEITYKNASQLIFMAIIWPLGLPCVLWVLATELVNKLGADKVAFKIPGGKK